MEKFELKINQYDRYDEILKNSLPDFGDVEIITKDGGMTSGRGIVMITFSVQLPDGSTARVQTCTSMKLFRSVAVALAATYTDDGFRQNMCDPLDDGIIEETG